MVETIIATGRDAFVDSAHAARNYGSTAGLPVETGATYALIWARNPAVKGETIEAAELTITAATATGARTLTCYRITQAWNDGSVTWNSRPPGVLVDTQSVGSLAVGDTVTFDVASAMQSATDGASYYGFMIRTSGARHIFWGFASAHPPKLDVTHGAAPATPSILTPAGGTIDKAKWIVGCDFTDYTGNTSMASIQVQVDDAANEISPAFDSGEVAATEPSLDLSTTAYSGLGSGDTTQWRVRVKDGSGLWSPWSDWVTVTYTPKSSLTITNPTGGAVGNPTPTITATFGGTLAFYQVRIYDASKTNILYDSAKLAADDPTDITLEIPAKYQGQRVLAVEDATYWVLVRAWDDEPRVPSTGSPVYVQEWEEFVLDDDASTAPDTVTATQIGTGPGVLVSWHLSAEPDSWIISRDGHVIATLDIADVESLGSGNYSWSDYAARPHIAHTYAVRAVNTGQKTPPGTADPVTTAPIGVWLVSEDGSLQVLITDGTDVTSARNKDQASTYQAVGSRAPMRIIDALGGRSLDGFAGELTSIGGRTVYQWEADALAIKAASADQYRWVTADDNLLVEINDLTVTAPNYGGGLIRVIAFGWTQVGEFEYGGRV